MRARQQSRDVLTVVDSESVDESASVCLLIVNEDYLITERIVSLLGPNCSITRFCCIEDASMWLDTYPPLDLVLVDAENGKQVVTAMRSHSGYRLIPILSVHHFINTHLVETALTVGMTDVLAVTEDDISLQSKMRYYLDLKKRVFAFLPDDQTTAPTKQFTLPWWKRAIDIGVSFSVLFVLSPLLLLTALLIRLDSKGPILYKSKRAGTNFRVFDMYKFRTMKAQADKLLSNLSAQNIYAKPTASPVDMAQFVCSDCLLRGISCQRLLVDQDQSICEKLYIQENEEVAKFMKFRNDPRITRIGTFLRNSSIDELPQLFNVLLGHMSLVGNRPLPLYEAEKLTTDESAQRFAGPAGLTGIWQVRKRAKGQGPMSDRERILLDIEYASTFSFKTDTYIMWRTIFSLWQKENV